jgi:protein SCO1/2
MRLAVAIVAITARVAAAAPAGTPAWAESADVTEHLGTAVPFDLAFTDTTGQRVPLRSLFDHTHPVLLVLAYYECPQLCSLVLDAAVRAMRQLDGQGFVLGSQYRVATISFDDSEHPDQAARKQAAVLGTLGKPDATAWPFMVGDEASVHALTDQLGFRFQRDARTGAIAHPAVAFVLTPDGVISRYLYGIDYPPRDLKLALLEASDGKTGSFGDRILLRCFHYDPTTRRYGLFVARFMQVGGALIFIVVLLVVGSFVRAGRRIRQERP